MFSSKIWVLKLSHNKLFLSRFHPVFNVFRLQGAEKVFFCHGIWFYFQTFRKRKHLAIVVSLCYGFERNSWKNQCQKWSEWLKVEQKDLCFIEKQTQGKDNQMPDNRYNKTSKVSFSEHMGHHWRVSWLQVCLVSRFLAVVPQNAFWDHLLHWGRFSSNDSIHAGCPVCKSSWIQLYMYCKDLLLEPNERLQHR